MVSLRVTAPASLWITKVADQGDHRRPAAALSDHDGLRIDQVAELVTTMFALLGSPATVSRVIRRLRPVLGRATAELARAGETPGGPGPTDSFPYRRTHRRDRDVLRRAADERVQRSSGSRPGRPSGRHRAPVPWRPSGQQGPDRVRHRRAVGHTPATEWTWQLAASASWVPPRSPAGANPAAGTSPTFNAPATAPAIGWHGRLEDFPEVLHTVTGLEIHRTWGWRLSE